MEVSRGFVSPSSLDKTESNEALVKSYAWLDRVDSIYDITDALLNEMSETLIL